MNKKDHCGVKGLLLPNTTATRNVVYDFIRKREAKA